MYWVHSLRVGEPRQRGRLMHEYIVTMVTAYTPTVCCLHIKSSFLPSFISTPSVRPDSVILRGTRYSFCGSQTAVNETEKDQKRIILINIANSWGKQVKHQRTGYENTTTQQA